MKNTAYFALSFWAGLALTTSAQLTVRPWSQTNEPLPTRVAADFKDRAHAASFVHYAVPAMSSIQRLPDIYPDDGTPGGAVRIVMARDEYEPGSFLVYGLEDLGKVQFSPGEFRTADGKVFPAGDLDLKVVKCWFQNRNAWYSYFGDTDFKLCPELLLNDEDLIRVDLAKKANYARLDDGDGKSHEWWLNPPRQLCKAFWPGGGESFGCMKPGFADADALCPVTVNKGEFKQFFFTAHAKKDTAPGLYRGEIRLQSGNRPLGTVPVEIRVLDFALPEPMCYFDETMPFYVSFYTYQRLDCLLELNGGDYELAKRQLLATLKDRVAHNDSIHWVPGVLSGQGKDALELANAAGCRRDVSLATVPVASQGGSYTELVSFDRRSAAAVRAALGHLNVYASFGDEPPAWWLQSVFPDLKAGHEAGYKFILAGSDNVYRKAGFFYDWHNIAKTAEDDSTTRLWNQFGSGPHVAWYANQHVGVENPEFNRRQNGMAAYLSGYSSLCNYAHHYGGYNDDSEGYRPMVFAYGQYKGVIDTIQWEGFREGVDDIRYATVLVTLARQAAKSANVDARYAGNKALQYLAAFRKDSDDLNTCRREMIRYIQELRRISDEF